MQTTTMFPPGRQRRPRPLGIEAHTEFVATLVAELRSSVTRLQASTDSAVEFGRQTDDLIRLVRLLDAIDGPGTDRHIIPLSLPAEVVAIADRLDLRVAVSGRWGSELFLVDAEAVRTGLELLLLAAGGDGTPAEIVVASDRLVAIDGTFDLTDPRTSWRLRSGRRVLEREGCSVRLLKTETGSRLVLRIED